MNKCKNCEKESLNPHYCSHSCQMIVRNRNRKNPDVNKTCEICFSVFEVSFRNRKKRVCSLSCRRKLQLQKIDLKKMGEKISKSHREGIDNGRISFGGKPHSDETKAHLSKIFTGRRKGSENAMFGKKHSDESRLMMSETRSKKIINGEYDKSKWAKRGEFFASKANRVIPYRSSFELRAIKKLEEDENVVSFKFESIRISYYYSAEDDRLRKRHYIPDFLVSYKDGRNIIIEIKPECYLQTAINVAKFASARIFCDENNFDFQVWTQKDIF